MSDVAAFLLMMGLIQFAGLAYSGTVRPSSRAWNLGNWCLGVAWIFLAVRDLAPVASMAHDVLGPIGAAGMVIWAACMIAEERARRARSRAESVAI